MAHFLWQFITARSDKAAIKIAWAAFRRWVKPPKPAPNPTEAWLDPAVWTPKAPPPANPFAPTSKVPPPAPPKGPPKA